jgi:hypothetical protein
VQLNVNPCKHEAETFLMDVNKKDERDRGAGSNLLISHLK